MINALGVEAIERAYRDSYDGNSEFRFKVIFP